MDDRSKPPTHDASGWYRRSPRPTDVKITSLRFQRRGEYVVTPPQRPSR